MGLITSVNDCTKSGPHGAEMLSFLKEGVTDCISTDKLDFLEVVWYDKELRSCKAEYLAYL